MAFRLQRMRRAKLSEYGRRYRPVSQQLATTSYEDALRYRSVRRSLEHCHTPICWNQDEPGPDEDDEEEQQHLESRSRSSTDTNVEQFPNETNNSDVENEPVEDTLLRGSAAESKGDSRKGPLKADNKSASRLLSTRPPFQLYGKGETGRSVGEQKTHNVLASSQSDYVHEAALRAKAVREAVSARCRNRVRRKRQRSDVHWMRRAAERRTLSKETSEWRTEYQRQFATASAQTLSDRFSRISLSAR